MYATQDATMTELSQPTDHAVPHILVVDDEPEILRMLSICLEKSSFHVSTAENTADAARMLSEEQFDVIISDVIMPGEDGIAFLGSVHESWPELPVILMTGHAQLQMAVNAIKNGAFDFVHKPFDFDHLRKIITRAVNYCHLQRMEKNYRSELEETVAQRTAELKASMVELDFARASLQQAATDKSTFMSTISHEMRTPMNGVIGSLELLAEENLNGDAAEYLAMARQSADNMMALIEQLLSFNASVVQNSGTLRHERFDLHLLLHTIIEAQQPHFSRKGLTLSLRIAENLPRLLWADREKLCRLMEILVGNALKFTAQGTVVLEAVPMNFAPEEDQLLLTVSDSGCGIPVGMLERIFEPFVQGDGSFARRHEGVGLGLSIARQIALLLNGHLWAEHNPSGGSRFSVSLNASSP
jgi:signal transduction histidine kinase